MKKILSVTICSLFACMIHAQITTGEPPYGLNNLNVTAAAKISGQAIITLPAPDLAAIALEDSENDSLPGPCTLCVSGGCELYARKFRRVADAD
jgi:hypothetical protein